jgi:uncharacterized membrane protein
MKMISLYIMSLLYIAAGINHFIHPEFYRKIMPPWVPLHDEMILISGIAEVLFALLLLFPFTRRFAACCIIALLIAVFPANIQMTLNYYHENNPGLWFTVVRLPLQIVLIWWAYLFTKPVNKINSK